MEKATPHMHAYFESIVEETNNAYKKAQEARKKGYDPVDTVEVEIVENMAQRAVGLVASLAPQLVGCGIDTRIQELEKEYGVIDWRVSLLIAEEVALQKFCAFKDNMEAIDIGIRVGASYHTLGVVNSPLDGIIGITVKKRQDGKDYFCISFAGPIRNAGGTGAAVFVLITDYIRKKMGYHPYDATIQEQKRAYVETIDYIEKCAPRQHTPCEEEMMHLMKHLPIEVSGSPSESIEVSSHKDLPRINTNIIRSGFCLLMSDCIPLKAPKLWKQLSKWGKDFGMDHWNFLEEFIQIQKDAKAKSSTADKKEEKIEEKISPNYSYIKDLAAGRPVLGYPLRHGGFRLRYGRSRFSGYSAQSIHPATMIILQEYIATGTQLKSERPGKATVVTACDTLQGPIVKLSTGEVVRVQSTEQARSLKNVEEILYLGDILAAYGDFFNRAHSLVPVGYCEEWWVQELEKSIKKNHENIVSKQVYQDTGISQERIEKILENFLRIIPTYEESKKLSTIYSIPLHPEYTPLWTALKKEHVQSLLYLFITKKEEQTVPHIITRYDQEQKRALELLGVPHKIEENVIVIEKEHALALKDMLTGKKSPEEGIKLLQEKRFDVLTFINRLSPYIVRDKGGVFVGSRMGRPEKAKQRKQVGSPHMMFPIGEEGGRLKCIQSCLEKGVITSEFPQYYCKQCNATTVFRRCEKCNKKTVQHYYCRSCNQWEKEDTCSKKETKNMPYSEQKIFIDELFRNTLKLLKLHSYPKLIKGVREVSNKDHHVEHLAKGILRSKHDVYTFKDGTIRYDMIQLPATHFKPKEVGTSIKKLQSLGYYKDIKGKEIISEDQIVELLPQDVILPRGIHAGEDGAEEVLRRVCNFIDEELVTLYKEESFYNIQTSEDLVGQLVVCLAPHTSAGTVGRIIGFSNTQGFWAHPYIHAATRRDCDGDESCVILLMDVLLNFSKKFLPSYRGGTMDAPLVLMSRLVPTAVDDMIFDVDIAWRYPLELYEAGQEYKKPWDVKVPIVKNVLDTTDQFENMGFTHDTTDMNDTVSCSAYKTLPTMKEKLDGQMELAQKIRAVDTKDVATLVIEKHFIRDSLGNLRKFTQQTFRCVKCNEKYRRVPLYGKCIQCHGKIIFTVSKGNILKYLEPTVELAETYGVNPYLQQAIQILKTRTEQVFMPEKEKQVVLGEWMKA